MLKINNIILLYSSIFYELSFSQKWITPTNRVLYALDGKAENLTWSMNYEGKKLFNARWTVYDENTRKEKVLVSVVGINPRIFYPNITLKYMIFKETDFDGVLSFYGLKSNSFHKIGCIVTFYDFTELQDYVNIKYVSYAPKFATELSSARVFVAGHSENITVKVIGDQEPTIIWKLKRNGLFDHQDLQVYKETTISINNDTIISSTLHIPEVRKSFKGILEVLGKYGNGDSISPTIKSKMKIFIEYPPQNMNFTSYITTDKLININYIKLICIADGKPKPTYTFAKASKELYTGNSNSTTFLANSFNKARYLMFTCNATNKHGTMAQYLKINTNLEDHKLSRYTNIQVTKRKWWPYFLVCAIIMLAVLLVISMVSFFVRRRTRSLTIIPGAHDDERSGCKQRRGVEVATEDDSSTSSNQVINTTLIRGSPDGNTKSHLHLNTDAYY